MSKKKVLFVTQELSPYTELTELSHLANLIPALASHQDYELRILMPKFGLINERRHRLHEVVRLSGMNIIVDDEDYPLIIKVASLPGARLQVYFLDNEEFFKRKAFFNDENGNPFEDNEERIVFFGKGVLETVKKFGWAPDIVHLHGQVTSMIPLYLKEAYKNDPVFSDAKVIYSIYEDLKLKNAKERFSEIGAINDLEPKHLEVFLDENKTDLNKGAIIYSDGIISGSESMNDYVKEYGDKLNLPYQTYQGEIEASAKGIIDFYNQILEGN